MHCSVEKNYGWQRFCAGFNKRSRLYESYLLMIKPEGNLLLLLLQILLQLLLPLVLWCISATYYAGVWKGRDSLVDCASHHITNLFIISEFDFTDSTA